MCEDHDDPGRVDEHASLVDVIARLLSSYQCNARSVGLTTFSSPWGVEAPASKVINAMTMCYFAMVQGQGYFCDQTMSEDLLLQAGDVLLFKNDCSHTFRDAPQTPVVPLIELLTPEIVNRQVGLVMGGGGKLTRFMAGFYVFRQVQSSRLFELLPHHIHLTGSKGRLPGAIGEYVRRMQEEIQSKRPGWRSIVDYMSRILLVKFLRHYQNQTSGLPLETLQSALDDPDISASLQLIHKDPGSNWTVQSLADAVGMSRSAFAARFQICLSQTPMAYVQAIRMHQACALLRDEQLGVKSIAARLGYASDASFSTAFKRWSGMSPGQFRKSGEHFDQLQTNVYHRAIMDP